VYLSSSSFPFPSSFIRTWTLLNLRSPVRVLVSFP
jgi:hypothetical protein